MVLALLTPLTMLVFLAIVLLLFGSRLPSTMRSLGKSITEFKKGIKEGELSEDEEEHEPERLPRSDR